MPILILPSSAHPLSPLFSPPMASHSHSIDNDDDDDFYEYNPYPYQGGYDIALTYGRPLPPSPSICYPIISHASPPPLPLPKTPSPSPAAPPLPPPPSEQPESLTEPEPEPEQERENCRWKEPYYAGPGGYGWPDLDFFGFWPQTGCRCGAEEAGYWNQLRRAGNYLFGYSQGYGERRIGVDSYGIPIYANKTEGSRAVSVQVEPARDLKVDWYESGDDNGNWSSYDEKTDRSYAYDYYEHSYEEPRHAEENIIEPMLTYHEGYEEQVYPKMEWWSSSSDEKKDKSYDYAYNKHYLEEPLHAEENFIVPMSHQRLAYHEVYEEPVYPELEWWTSSYDEKKDTSYGYTYNKYHYEEALHAEENQRLTYHEVYDEQVYPKLEMQTFSEYGYESKIFVNHAYERHHDEPLCVELEPYKPTWSQNLNYRELYGRELSYELNCHSSMDKGAWDESNVFEDPNDVYGCHYYEQQTCAQLEPFKPAWAQNPSMYEPYIQDNSQPSWVDDSFKEYGAQFFSPFVEHSQYDDNIS